MEVLWLSLEEILILGVVLAALGFLRSLAGAEWVGGSFLRGLVIEKRKMVRFWSVFVTFENEAMQPPVQMHKASGL